MWSACYHLLMVTSVVAAQIPVIVEEAEPRVLMSAANGTRLPCKAEGNPSPAIVWAYGGSGALAADVPGLRRVEPDGSLLFLPFPAHRYRPEVHAATYRCLASNPFGTTTSRDIHLVTEVVPVFRYTFQEETVKAGFYVSLRCTAWGVPTPSISWHLDGAWTMVNRRGLSVGQSTSEVEGEVLSQVNISAADVSDSGAYACRAFNNVGSVEHERRLNVVGHLFLRSFPNFTALAGERFRVQCPFGGYPFDSVSWKKDGRLLPLHQRQSVYPNGTLVIRTVDNHADQGHYTCEVTSPQGQKVQRTFPITIISAPRLAPFTFQPGLQEGMRTAATCVVAEGDGPLSLAWLRDGRPLALPGATISHVEGGFASTLTIARLAAHHAGDYTCVARNAVAEASITARLDVNVAPRWILEPGDTSAVEGQPLTVHCQAEGIPAPVVRWKTAEAPDRFRTIVSSADVHILANGSLAIRRVSRESQGMYLCEASNGVGSPLAKVIKIIIHQPPRVEGQFGPEQPRKGEKAELECKSSGDLPITFTWKKNGIPIDPSTQPRYRVGSHDTSEGSVSTLTIHAAERADSGLITCRVTNKYGKDEASHQLLVMDVPGTPPNLEGSDISSRSVRLSWLSPDTGNIPVKEYTVVWTRQLGDDESTEEASTGVQTNVPGSDLSTTIKGLSPVTTYTFRVRAVNSVGQGDLSEPLTVTTLDEPPRHAPLFVQAFPVSSQSINVSWEWPVEKDKFGIADNFYLGFKLQGSAESYTFKLIPRQMEARRRHQALLEGLRRAVQYAVIVQAYNSRGAGPPSEDLLVRTLELDPPAIPILKTSFTTTNSIQVAWQVETRDHAPITGYSLYYRRLEETTDEESWTERHVGSDRWTYTLQGLQCGSAYQLYLVAFNNVSRSPASDIVDAKTDGKLPVPPEQTALIKANSSAAVLHLDAWRREGACPVLYFVVQYRACGAPGDWLLHSNNVVPEQRSVALPDLAPGTWYCLLMAAHSEAGATDAEYVFPTLTLTGELPPRSAPVSSLSLYRHMTVTVPVVSSSVVLAVVLAVVCLVSRRKPGPARQPRSLQGCGSSDNLKHDALQLAVSLEPPRGYLPEPYASSALPPPAYRASYDVPRKVGSGYNNCLSERQTTISYQLEDGTLATIEEDHYRRLRRKNSASKISWRQQDTDGDISSEGESEDLEQEKARLHKNREHSDAECDRGWKKSDKGSVMTEKQYYCYGRHQELLSV